MNHNFEIFIINKKTKGGRHGINKSLKKSVHSYLEANSEISANRTIIDKDSNNQKITKHVRHRILPIYELYYNFPFKEELSFPTFYSHIGVEFKKPYRHSDLCDW